MFKLKSTSPLLAAYRFCSYDAGFTDYDWLMARMNRVPDPTNLCEIFGTIGKRIAFPLVSIIGTVVLLSLYFAYGNTLMGLAYAAGILLFFMAVLVAGLIAVGLVIGGIITVCIWVGTNFSSDEPSMVGEVMQSIKDKTCVLVEIEND